MEATDTRMAAPAADRHAIVVANGDADPTRLQALIDTDPRPLLIAADGGARAVLEVGFLPDLVVGDGDSLTAADRDRLVAAGVELRLASPDKDESDTELCLLAAIEAGAARITIHGAFGGDRPEHTIANLLLLADPRLDGREVALHADGSRITRIGADDGGGRLDIVGAPGDYVSLFAVGGPVTGVRTTGLRFPLADETLTVGPTRGLSNELEGHDARVETRRGRLLVVVTPRETTTPRADEGMDHT
jgi:thiamine pyrophosphokinase